MRKNFFISIILLALTLTSLAQTPAFKTEQYQKALWMTTRFYGAQRMGNGVNWLTEGLTWDAAQDGGWIKSQRGHKDGYTSGKSFLKDADGSYDLTGGWFDCGDHALFGQTFFYAAYSLLLGYSEFENGYGDYYSADYHGYISADKFSWEDAKGVPNGIPDILDECKHATDWMLKAVRDNKTFYYQKGVGDLDHKNWVTSVMMSSFNKDEGGEYDGPREVGKATGNATSMAALAGASLAVMSRVYAGYDAKYAAQCLAKAKVAYEFVMGTTMGNTGAYNGGEYPAKSKFQPDITILCAEMYRATGDKTYLTKCDEYTAKWINDYNHGWTLCYNNTEDLGLYAYAAMGASCTYYSQAKSNLKQLTDKYNGSNYMLNTSNTGWGDLRYMAAQCLAKALNAKLQASTTIDPYVLTSVDYIMGNNSGKQSYITGFGQKSPLYPHHRNYYRSDEGNVANVKDNVSETYKYRQFGYLVGGVYDGTYKDDPNNYQNGEGGIDYNCGLVGALAYINSMIAPVEKKEVTKIEMYKQPANTKYTIGDKINLNNAQIKVTYSDNSLEYLDVTESMVSGFSSEKVAESITITVTYEKKTTTFTVSVEKQPVRIELSATPKTEYIRGESLSVKGGMIHYIYNDKSYDEVSLTSAMVAGFSSVTVGTKTLTITYKDLKTTYDVTIATPPITEIVMSPQPSKKLYQVNEAEDLTGGKVKVYYQGGEYDLIDLTPEMVSGFSSQIAAVYTIKVTYKGFETSYKITVEKHPSELTIHKMPKTAYVTGDVLDVDAGRLKYTYNDGTYDLVVMEIEMVTGFNNNETGYKTLTVNYQGMTVTYDVLFTKAPIESIRISSQPTKTTYKYGEAIDLTGAQLKVSYSGTDADIIDVTAAMVSGYDAYKAGSQTITVDYMGRKTTFTVTVEAKEEPKPEDPEEPGKDPEEPGTDPETPEAPNTPVENISPVNTLIYSYDNVIHIENFSGLVEVFSLSGAKVFSGSNVSDIRIHNAGIYIVRAGGATRKVAIN